jgi:hypothetical protein
MKAILRTMKTKGIPTIGTKMILILVVEEIHTFLDVMKGASFHSSSFKRFYL